MEKSGTISHGGLTSRRLAAWIIAAAVMTTLIAVMAPLAGGGLDLAAALADGPWRAEHETPDGLIFWQTRLPRVLTGLLAGGALGLSGVAFQAVLRNPLAEPYILGVSAGAAAGKAVAVLMLPAALGMAWFATPLMCFFGALAPLLFLARLAVRQRRFSPVSLLLAGIMLNIILSAAMMLVQVFAPPMEARQITYWWLGGLDVAGYDAQLASLPQLAAGVILVIWRSRAMNLLSVDEITASHLGVDAARETWLLLGAGTLLAAAAVALCGPIGFVGLLVPHILRLAAGPDHRLLAPLSVLAGGGFLVLCDLIGWRGFEALAAIGAPVAPERQVPAGVITALLGGPVFLWLLVRQERR